MSIVSPSLIRHAVRGMRAAPVSPHAFAGRVPEETVDWAGSFGLLPSDREKEQALRIRVGDLAALTFTRHSVDVVRLGADLILWLYLFDDAIGEASPAVEFDQHREQLAKFERLLRFGGHGEAEPFLRSLADIRRRATQLNAGDDWHRRFADDMTDYFAGCADEAIYRRARMTPNIQVYRALRAQTVGTSAVFAIAELGDADQPRPGEMVRAEVVEARRVAAQLTAWVNDIYSYPKEAAQGDPMNLVAAISRERGLDPADAVTRAVVAYNVDLERLDALVTRIRGTSPSAALLRYLDDLVAWVHGNRAWTRLCGRYQ